MATFTFIETCDRNFGDESRVIALRGTNMSAKAMRHFDRYMRMHPNRCIAAIYQTDMPTLADAKAWMQECFACG